MQEYFRPEASIKLQEKQDMFKIRSRIIYITENLRGKSTNFNVKHVRKMAKERKKFNNTFTNAKNLTKRETKLIATNYLKTKQTN